MEQSTTAEGRCPTCGAPSQPQAALCIYCGSELASLPVESPQVAGEDEVMSPSDASSAGMEQSHAASGQRRCGWCGTLSPEDADRCQHCGAAFPRPEQDEALLRASQERIRVANDSIQLMHKERERKSLGRFFGR
jgi:hypothetical protein